MGGRRKTSGETWNENNAVTTRIGFDGSAAPTSDRRLHEMGSFAKYCQTLFLDKCFTQRARSTRQQSSSASEADGMVVVTDKLTSGSLAGA